MARSQDVSKALEILSELTLAWKSEEAKDSAATYTAIYLYLQSGWSKRILQQSDSIFAEVEDMLSPWLKTGMAFEIWSKRAAWQWTSARRSL